jgi:hypothetical protein
VRYLIGALALGLATGPAEPVAAQQVKAGVLSCDVSGGNGADPWLRHQNQPASLRDSAALVMLWDTLWENIATGENDQTKQSRRAEAASALNDYLVGFFPLGGSFNNSAGSTWSALANLPITLRLAKKTPFSIWLK